MRTVAIWIVHLVLGVVLLGICPPALARAADRSLWQLVDDLSATAPFNKTRFEQTVGVVTKWDGNDGHVDSAYTEYWVSGQTQELEGGVSIVRSTLAISKLPQSVGQVSGGYLHLDGACIAQGIVQDRFPDAALALDIYEKPITRHAWYRSNREWGSLVFRYPVEKRAAVPAPQTCLDEVAFDFSPSS